MTTKNNRISYLPTEGYTFDPSNPKYWEKKSLDKEIERTYEICHGCRMCFKYCDTFPILFNFLDKQYDGDVKKVTEKDSFKIMESCFQCKLCEVQCPYTVRDKHEFKLDFPKLVHRYKAINSLKKDKSLRDKFLGNPDKTAKLARKSFGIANIMNRVSLHRWFLEKLLGIHRKKLLPDFKIKTFENFAYKKGLIKNNIKAETVLFQTCYVQYNEPQIGKDTIEVLEKNKVDCACVSGLKCCGMPAWEQGDLKTVRKNAKTNLDILMPFVERGSKVLPINPTCSMMMRREYKELLEGEDRERAYKLAESINDPSEYLWSIRNEERFCNDGKNLSNETISYHAPCHLRAQGVGFKGRDLIRKVTGSNVKTVLDCCGHDGTFAMKVESFDASIRIGQKSFQQMKNQQTEIWATDCPLAAIQFQQHAGVKPKHPMTILAEAYRSI